MQRKVHEYDRIEAKYIGRQAMLWQQMKEKQGVREKKCCIMYNKNNIKLDSFKKRKNVRL